LELRSLEHVCPRALVLAGNVRPSRLRGVLEAWTALGIERFGGEASSGSLLARFDGVRGEGTPGAQTVPERAARAVVDAGGWYRWRGAWRPRAGGRPEPWGGVETPWPL